MTLEQVIDLLKNNFEEAKSHTFIKKPMSYALYVTWQMVNAYEKPRAEEVKECSKDTQS